jgi:Tfp pilus assembly protein PilF
LDGTDDPINRKYHNTRPETPQYRHLSAQIFGTVSQAVSLFRKGLESVDGAILDGFDTRQSIQLELAEALLATTDTDAASALLEAIIESPADSRSDAWARNLAGDAALLDGDVEYARSRYEECEAIARSIDDREIITEVCCDLAELHNREYERSIASDASRAAHHRKLYIAYATEAHSLVELVGSAQTRARIYRNAAKRLRAEGDLVAAKRLYEESLQAADMRTSGHRFLIPYAKALRLLGDIEGALREVERVLTWSAQVGSVRSTAIGLQYRGLMLMSRTGDPESLAHAMDSLKEAARQHRIIGYKQGQRETDVLLGEVSLRSGSPDSAHDYFRRALGTSSPFGETCVAVAAELEANGEVDRAQYLREAVGAS